MVHSVVAAAGVDDPWSRRALLIAAVLTPLWVYLSPARLRDYAVLGGLVGGVVGAARRPASQQDSARDVRGAVHAGPGPGRDARSRWVRAEIPAQVVLALTLLMCAEALHLIFIAPLELAGPDLGGRPRRHRPERLPERPAALGVRRRAAAARPRRRGVVPARAACG